MTKKQKYREGSWFAVPLKSEFLAVGLVARTTNPRAGVLAYFFNKRFRSIPDLKELKGLSPSDAIKVICVGDLGLINREWKVIGELPNWDRSQWVVPQFVRREDITNRCWLVTYSDEDVNVIESEELLKKDRVDLEDDSAWGHGAVEKMLPRWFGEE